VSKIVIEGQRFDTSKAKKQWNMAYWDGSNWIQGELYLSSKGQWYMYSPSQWSNGHHWELTSPAEVLENYRNYFEDPVIEEIAAYVEDWE
jgi:hypothetical protein